VPSNLQYHYGPVKRSEVLTVLKKVMFAAGEDV
jgi:hypothetical protein